MSEQYIPPGTVARELERRGMQTNEARLWLMFCELLTAYEAIDELLDGFMANGEPTREERRQQRRSNRRYRKAARFCQRRLARTKPHA